MKKLVVSGCSWGDLDFFSQFHPDMDCSWRKWPNIVAEKMNMEPVNLCKSGAGNEYIYSSISDYLQETPHDEIGYVIAAWSTAPRRCYKVRDRWINDRQDLRGDLPYWIERSIRTKYAFQNLMEQTKLPYLHFQMISLYRGHLWDLLKKPSVPHEYKKLKHLTQEVLKNTKYKFNDKYLNWPTDEELGGSTVEFSVLKEHHKISELDRHPNAEGQVKIAEYVYDKLG